jgi:ribosomal protein S18 acetylase RimI-like enzyme
LLAGSEPWLTLGTTFEQCRKTCNDPEYLLCVAHLNDNPCGVIVLHHRGVASSPYVKSIVVAGEYRGHSIGKAMMEFAENLFRNGCDF